MCVSVSCVSCVNNKIAQNKFYILYMFLPTSKKVYLFCDLSFIHYQVFTANHATTTLLHFFYCNLASPRTTNYRVHQKSIVDQYANAFQMRGVGQHVHRLQHSGCQTAVTGAQHCNVTGQRDRVTRDIANGQFLFQPCTVFSQCN